MKEEKPQTRIDLTDYRVYLDVLLSRMNEESAYRMMTDLIKLLIEKAMKNYCPDVIINPSRTPYIKLEI